MTIGIVPVGRNATKLWGLAPEERLRRLARAQGLEWESGDELVLANVDYAFDPAWLKLAAAEPDRAIARGGVPVLARVAAGRGDDVRRAMEEGTKLDPSGEIAVVEADSFGELENHALRKRERPFMERLTWATRPMIERRSYYASYKGVTDLLTKYLWPEWAFHLTRLAARIGLSPNAVTTIGAVLCALAAVAFWQGWYWSGIAAGFVFMVLDTVDGKLARCTITSSWWGNVFDHGIDLVHPLIWWWAWAEGLHNYGRPLAPDMFAGVMIVLVAGYVVQRLIEGAFILQFGIHIHVWRKLDSDFRLVTARRNPNMVILVAALAAGRPDQGIVAVAAWTLLSCLFHLIRLLQAWLDRARGHPIESWLS